MAFTHRIKKKMKWVEVITGLGPPINFHVRETESEGVKEMMCGVAFIEFWVITISLSES